MLTLPIELSFESPANKKKTREEMNIASFLTIFAILGHSRLIAVTFTFLYLFRTIF